jgi:hypothetical protein
VAEQGGAVSDVAFRRMERQRPLTPDRAAKSGGVLAAVSDTAFRMERRRPLTPNGVAKSGGMLAARGGGVRRCV